MKRNSLGGISEYSHGLYRAVVLTSLTLGVVMSTVEPPAIPRGGTDLTDTASRDVHR